MSEQKHKLTMVMEMVDKYTAPFQKVTDQSKKSAVAIENTHKQLKRLQQTSGDLESFKQLKRESANTERALDAQQKKVAQLAQQIKQAETPSRALTNEFNRAKREAQQLTKQHEKENTQLSEMRTRLNAAGVSTKNLRQATSQLERHTARVNQRLEEQQRKLEAVAQREKKLTALRDKNSALMGSAAMDTAKVGAAVFAMKQLTDSYGEVASAQGTIQSLGIGAEGIEEITQAAKDFTNQWAGTTQAEFIAASYDIKSGISSLSDAAVGEFTRIAAMTAGATKSTTDQMTSLFASGYGIYRKQFDKFGADTVAGWNAMSEQERDMQFGKYFSAGIASSVQAFKTDGENMSAAISNLGAAATSANVSFAEQLSVLGQLQATMSGSEAATKYKAFLGSAARAGDQLGLSFLDANNQLKGMPDILAELQSKYGDTIDAVEEQELKKAFGTDEAMALIKLLYPETDKLKENILSMNGALQGGMDTTNKMAAAILNGPTESTQRMNQRVQNLTATLGKVFAPMMMFITDTVGESAMMIANFAEKFPFLTQMIGGAIMAIIALKTGLIAVKAAQIAYNFAMITSMQSMGIMATMQKALAFGAKAWAVAQWGLNAALNANPIGLVVLAVMALIGVVPLVIKYWEPLGEFFTNLWDGIVSKFTGAMETIGALVGKVAGWWNSLFGDDETAVKNIAMNGQVTTSGSSPALAASGGVMPYQAKTGISASRGASNTYQTENKIQIVQQPGESQDDLARRVAEEMDRRERDRARRQRGALYD